MASAAEPLIGVLDEALDLRIEVGQDGMARIIRLAARDAPEPPPAPPSRRSANRPGASAPPREPASRRRRPDRPTRRCRCSTWSSRARGRPGPATATANREAGGRFRYVGHDRADLPGGWRELRVDLADPVSGLRAEVFYRVLVGQGALRCWVRLTNAGPAPVTVESVTSFLCGGLSSGPGPTGADGVVATAPDDLDDLDVLWAENDWLAEGRWQRRGLRDALPDLNRQAHGADPRGRFGLTSTGTWSSGVYLPMGAVVSRRTGHAWAWQIEHNGGWHWQTGECTHRYRAAGPGPTAGTPCGVGQRRLSGSPRPGRRRAPLADHAEPRARTSDRAGRARRQRGRVDGAFAALTALPTRVRRPHPDHHAFR